MKLKTIIIGLLVVVSLTASAQSNDVLSVELKERTSDISLNGKAGVLFIGESDDYVITSSDKSDGECQTAHKVNGHYEYRMFIDLKDRKSDSRTFTVTKKGTPYQGKSVQKDIYVDNNSIYIIAEVNTKLGSKEQISDGTYLKEEGNRPVKACIEITVPQDLSLQVNVNKALNAEKTSVTKAGNVVYEVVFDTNRFSQLEEVVANYKKQIDEIVAKVGAEKDERVKQGLYKQQDYIQDTLLVQAQNDLANAAIITIEGKGVNTLTVDPNKIRSLKPKAKFLYGVVVVEKEVVKEYSFDELLAQAKKRYQEYPQHTDFAFYEGAMTAYKNAMSHKDCPDAMRKPLQVEYDSIISMRKWVNFYERAAELASKAERDSKDEYKCLIAQSKSIKQLLRYHPEIKGFYSIKRQVEEQISKNSNNYNTVKRQRVSGKVSFANESDSEPFSSLTIFGSPVEKVDRKLSTRIGRVNSDGSYSVLIPDGVDYIYVTGEKKAHYIGNKREHLDIEIGGKGNNDDKRRAAEMLEMSY